MIVFSSVLFFYPYLKESTVLVLKRTNFIAEGLYDFSKHIKLGLESWLPSLQIDSRFKPIFISINTGNTLPLLFLGITLLITSIVILINLRNTSTFKKKISGELKTNSHVNDKLTNNEIHEQEVKIEELKKYHERIIALLAHDLKNPLNIILHHLEDIPNPETRQSVENAGKLMMNMLQNVLDVQQYNTSKLPLNREIVNLVDLISDCTNSVQYLSNKKNIRIVYKSDLNFWVNIDHAIMTRVMVSLLIDIIKYTPFNETIIIRSESRNNHLRLSIHCNISGDEAQKIENIFNSQNYAQNENTAINSTYLRFQFCTLAIASHNEQIGFNRDKLKGSKMWLTLALEDIKEEEVGILAQREQEVIAFTSQEIETISLHVDRLREHSIFELSKIKSIIKDIPNAGNGIVEWKNQVSLALSSMNEQRFLSLLDSVSQSTIKHEE